jgi:lysosomal alpha-glucosidase
MQDIDYMRNHLDFTYDAVAFGNLPALVENLHAHNQHYIMIVDPGISNTQAPGAYAPYDDGIKQDVFIKNASGGILVGSVWPGNTAFPDFLNPATVKYWQQQVLYDSLLRFFTSCV